MGCGVAFAGLRCGGSLDSGAGAGLWALGSVAAFEFAEFHGGASAATEVLAAGDAYARRVVGDHDVVEVDLTVGGVERTSNQWFGVGTACIGCVVVHERVVRDLVLGDRVV